MSNSNQTAIIILNWNCEDTIFKCIDSVLNATEEKNIIVIDNGSTDDSMPRIEQKYPKVKKIYNHKNLGFSTAINIGIKESIENKYDFVALLNPDAYIETSWLQELEKVLKNKPDVAIATGKLINPLTNKIDAAGDVVSDWLLPYIRGEGDDDKNWTKEGYVTSGTAGGSIYRLKMLEQIGFFDEKYFLYYEDTDVGLRSLHYGWKTYYQPKAIGYHIRNTSSKKVPGVVIQQAVRNRHLLVLKTMPINVLLRHGYKFYMSTPLFTLSSIRKGYIRPALSSLYQSVTITPYALKQRKEIMKNRVISSSEFSKLAITPGPPPIRFLQNLSKVFK